MSEPAALDLADIVHRAAVVLRLRQDRSGDVRALLERDIPELVNELERCRAERDALRARVLTLASNVAFLHGAHHPLNVAFADCDYSACRGARAALGEVTQ